MVNEYNKGPVYTITGRTVDECKTKLFEMYNNEYQPVGIDHDLKGGFLGFGQREVVTIKYVLNSRKNSSEMKNTDDFDRNKEELLSKLTPSVNTTKQFVTINDSIKQLSDMVTEGFRKINSSPDAPHNTIVRISEILEENEFTKDYIKNITDKIRSEFSLEELDDFDAVEKKVVDWIGESIEIAKKRAFRPPHVIIVVGPTGVGKTTTIAKIAAQQIIGAKNEKREIPKIRLISADITRVAAEEQLKHYAEAMGVPIDKAESSDDIKKIYRDNKESTDVILIDTSGYSPNDSESIGRLKKNLSVDGIRPDIYLAVSASTKAKDLVNIIQNYEPFAFSSVILTKCDETGQYGNVLSILAEKHKAISFVTYGQPVARNISRANVVDFLIRLNGFKIDRAHIEDKFGE